MNNIVPVAPALPSAAEATVLDPKFASPHASRPQTQAIRRNAGMITAKPIRLTTPKMVLRWPWLDQPNYGTDAFPKPEGEYSTRAEGSLSDPAVQALVAALAPLQDAARAEAEERFTQLKPEIRRKHGAVRMADPFLAVCDEADEPTGSVQFSFRMKASGRSRYEAGFAAETGRVARRWNRKPDVFDARGAFIPNVPRVRNGTVARISFEVRPYFISALGLAGLQLSLAGVQIIQLVREQRATAADHGFVKEEGYVHEEPLADIR